VRRWIAALLFAGSTLLAQAQSAQPPLTPVAPFTLGQEPHDRGVYLKSLPRNIFQDQRALFTSPFRMTEQQWKFVVPVAALTVGLVASDTAVQAHVTKDPSTASRSKTLSDAGVVALAGVSGGMYIWGSLAKNERQRETGFLSGEAAINAFIDTSIIKYAAGRERPFTGSGQGNFFSGGNSFPSQHAAVSWAIASVIAHEYPGTLTKILSYGAASAVSVARVQGHQHYMSDVVIGSAVGWYLGRQVYRSRSSEAEIDVRNWGKFIKDENTESVRVATSQMGSDYVPLDSWIYESFDRLAAMGYVPTGSATVRPWTRLECARLLAEANEMYEEDDPVAEPLLAALESELASETNVLEGGKNNAAEVESIYGRFTGISGTPLRDSFHFAQTLKDDYGRPYGQGVNAIAGFSTRAKSGPLAIYLRGEYQYASAIPEYNSIAQQTVANSDRLPFGWNMRSGTTSRFRTVEAYAALNVQGWQFSFGQQALWWGPNRSTSLILSNNAEAMPMLRVAKVSPMKLGVLGPVHFDFFIGRVGGVHYARIGPTFILHGNAQEPLDPPPYMWGVNLSIKPTENFELGFGHNAIFAGYGRPLNLKTFLHTFSNTGNAQAVEPGKRTTEFNFSYRVPKLRNWLTIYSEMFAYDSPIEGAVDSRYAFDPGIYMPRLPGLRKLDLRAEGVYTNLPGLAAQGNFYENAHYAQGYTGYGQIFGSWIGRQASGGQASSTYWFSARNKATVTYRKMVADKTFLQGGNLQDFSGSVTWMVRPRIEVSAMSQYEIWNFPLLATGRKSDITVSLGIRVFPKAHLGAN